MVEQGILNSIHLRRDRIYRSGADVCLSEFHVLDNDHQHKLPKYLEVSQKLLHEILKGLHLRNTFIYSWSILIKSTSTLVKITSQLLLL